MKVADDAQIANSPQQVMVTYLHIRCVCQAPRLDGIERTEVTRSGFEMRSFSSSQSLTFIFATAIEGHQPWNHHPLHPPP